MSMGLRTIILKLHKPSKAKQKIIDEALINYNMALRFLISKAHPDLQELKKNFIGKGGQYNILGLSKLIDNDLNLELNKFDVQPFKDSLKLEFAITMANYLRESIGSEVALSNLKVFDEEKLEDFRKLHPVYFCRYDTKRSYCLLYDREKDRYYAKLYLLNSANARKVSDHSGRREGLVYIHKDKRALEKSKRKETYIIVPLSFGKWQEKILKEAVESPESFKTARLMKKNNEYYLAVSLIVSKTESIKASVFMGISRALKNKLNYTVVGLDGEILSSGSVENSDKYQNHLEMSINELHESANFIASTAALYKAQVIVENLNGKGDKLNWVEGGQEQYHCECKWKEYNQLIRLLEYKLEWKGLPKPIKVSAVDIFCRCCNCGLSSKKNRQTEDFFICTACGNAMDIDKLGSLNLARKLINYSSSKIKIDAIQVEGGVIFSNKILGLDCFSSFKENQQERLKEEIKGIIESTRYDANGLKDKAQARRMSLIKKLKSAKDFMDLIEYN